MRINILRLNAFGPFTGKTLCLDGPNTALHMIFGPNEAGKSSMLRALRGLLFGLGHTSEDAHLHALKDLSVGATLHLDEGRILDLTRHKRRKNDLVDATGQPVEQRQFISWLGGIGADLFSQMFGLDQDVLRRGADNLLLGQGDLGQALFAAASGIADLRQILADLQKEQDELFRPRAFTTDIPKHATELANLSRELRECAVKPAHWIRLHRDMQDRQSRQENLQKQIFLLDKTMARHQRHQGALKHIEVREELERRLRDLRDVPLLSDDFTERRATARQALAEAIREQERLNFRLDQNRMECSSLVINQQLLHAEADIHGLYSNVARHCKALEDSRLLAAGCQALQASIAEKLERLGQGGDTGPTSERPPRPACIRMESLARARGGLDAEHKAGVQSLEEANLALAQARAELDGMDQLPDTLPLETLLAKAGELGNPAHRIREIQAEAQNLNQGIESDISALGLAPKGPAEVRSLWLPLPETIDRFASEMEERNARAAALRKEAKRLDAALLEKQCALTRLEQNGHLPDPAALAAARDVRDAGWQLIKAEWLAGQSAPDEAAALVRSVPNAADLCEAFELSKGRADNLADALFHDAGKVTQAITLRRDLERLDQERRQILTQTEETDQAMAAQDHEWRGVWTALGIAPLSPKEMRGWLSKVLDLRRRALEMLQHETVAFGLLEELQQLFLESRQTILEMGKAVPEHADYAALLSQAKALLAARQQQEAAGREVKRRIQELTLSRDKAQARLDRVVQALESWERDWSATMKEMRLPLHSAPEAAQAAAHSLEEIAAQGRELAEKEKRIADMDREYREFSDQVARLHCFAPAAATQARPEDLIGLVHAALVEEKEKAARHKVLLKEQSQLEQQLQASMASGVDSEKNLAELCAEAGCADAAHLAQAEVQARAKRDAQNARDNLEERLLELAGGEKLESFITAAREHDPDELSAELERLTATRTELATQRDECLAEIGRLKGELNALDGTSRAAEINQRIQEVKADIQERTGRFLRLRLASTVLTREIERFREANQGPVLAKAGEFFAAMTLNSFAGLTADYDAKGDPAIKAVRGGLDGPQLSVKQLSEGTRDQLYLALRLGGLWRYLQTNPPLPLIVDDILVNFDDLRSAATLRILSEISASTQVLFFTHHAHLVEIARGCLPAEALQVHEL